MKKVFAIAVMAIFLMPLAITFVTATTNPSMVPTTLDPPSTGNQNRDRVLNNAEQRNMFGIFSYEQSTGNVSGRFLTFVVDKNTGTITDYTIRRETGAILLLDQVQLAAFTSSSNPRVDGAMFAFNGTNIRIMAHNNPPAILLYRTQGAGNTVTYALSSGFSATAIPNSTNVAIDGNGEHAILLIENGTASIAGSNITVDLQPWAKTVLRFQPDIGLQAQLNQTMVNDAISSGKLACECCIVAYNGTIEQDFVGYQEGLTLRIQEAVQNRVEMRISAQFSEGKIIMIGIDNGTINAQNAQQIGLTIDGIKLQQSANAGDVLTAQGSESKYYVASAGGAFQLVLYMGHFSEHTVVVELTSSSTQLPTQLIVIAVIAVVALVALAAIVAMKKRHVA